MAGMALIRADDHLILGLRWSGFTVSGAGVAPSLVAGAQARLVVLLPPQHIAEETSPPGSAAPLQLPTGPGGANVPVWRGVLSAPTRLAFGVPQGSQIPPEGGLSRWPAPAPSPPVVHVSGICSAHASARSHCGAGHGAEPTPGRDGIGTRRRTIPVP